MAKKDKNFEEIERGDFQTPLELAYACCNYLVKQGTSPDVVIEPTCGIGNFLIAAMESFENADLFLGLELDPDHASSAREKLSNLGRTDKWTIHQVDFFKADLRKIVEGDVRQTLIIGNPPWVTNSELGSLGSGNLPTKSNFQNMSGIDAITGKANFDISEWIILSLLDQFENTATTIALLCKTTVATKILRNVNQTDRSVKHFATISIDAKKWFKVSVDACLVVIELQPQKVNLNRPIDCKIRSSFEEDAEVKSIGFRDSNLVYDLDTYEKWKAILTSSKENAWKWRSGIKHDCSKVMEFRITKDGLINGHGEVVELEDKYVFPLFKGSAVANKRMQPNRAVLVTQRKVGDETTHIRHDAPLTWDYLKKNADALDGRKSTIYKSRPRFSVFAVGEYAYKPWKLAIAGLYKRLNFVIFGPVNGKPVFFDDTVNFLSFDDERAATFAKDIYTSQPVTELFNAIIEWNAKRPITTTILRSIDFEKAAKACGRHDEYLRLFPKKRT